ncbi:MAG: cation diffusion facilitator family transporter [Gammaproteobacteria bacterium]|nr:cation diffusion facilitator family transporter [Gammaproteobacteria bacterium]
MEAEERQRTTQRVTLVGAAINAGLACIQIVFGLLGKSQALLADGLHTLADLSSDIVVLLAARGAAREADESHPYGHGRIETLASLLLGGMLMLVALGIGARGIRSVLSSDSVNPEPITIAFAAIAIVAKEGLYQYTRRAARRIHSSLLEANAWHHRSDALSSIVVVCGITAQVLGVPHMDALAAVVVAGMILWIGFRLVRQSLSELIDTSLDTALVEEIRGAMQGHASVSGIHNLRTRSMGGLGYIDAHIEVDSDLTVSEAHYIAHKMEQLVKRRFPQIADVQIHIDPLDDNVKESVLARLPERDKIEADLAQAWDDIPEREQVSQVKLHYLEHKIEIDLVMPVSMSLAGAAGALERLRSGADSLDYVGKVNVYYTETNALK